MTFKAGDIVESAGKKYKITDMGDMFKQDARVKFTVREVDQNGNLVSAPVPIYDDQGFIKSS